MRVPRKLPAARSCLYTAGLLAASCLAGSPSVRAADYPVLRGSQIEQPIEPPADAINWAGFYVGGGAGIAETKFQPGTGLQDLARFAYRNTLLGTQVDMGALVNNLPEKTDSGAIYHGYFGYNVPFDDVVLGFEFDYNRVGHSYSVADYIARRFLDSSGTVHDFSLTTFQAAKLHDYGTARIRGGWTYGRFMPFGTLGLAVGRFNTNTQITATDYIYQTNPATGLIQQGMAAGYPLTVGGPKKNVYAFGVAFGGGLDIALTDNIFLRGEYQHIRFADVEGTTTTMNTGRVSAAVKF